MVISTIALGSISYVCLAAGSRLLSEDDLATFVSLWALINTVVLTVVLPVEHLSPRLIAKRVPDLTIAGIALTLAVASGGIGIAVGVLIDGFSGSHLAAVALVVGLGAWSAVRAVIVGHGAFDRLATSSVMTLLATIAGLAATWVLGRSSAGALLLVAGAAHLMGGALMARRAFRSHEQGQVRPPRSELLLLGSMIAATFVTLLQSNGPMALGIAWGVSASDLVVYAGLLSLVRVPFMLLNNVMAPLNLRFADLAANGQVTQLIRTAAIALAGMSAAITVTVAGVVTVGGLGFRLLIGTDYTFNPSLAAGVVVSEGLIWMTVVPRLVSGALGVGWLMVASWSAGLIAFTGIALSSLDAVARLVIAPAASALTVLLMSVPVLLAVHRKRSIP
jgi:hypothetical protein